MLPISPKTVDVHRADVMRKLEARSVRDLLLYADAACAGQTWAGRSCAP